MTTYGFKKNKGKKEVYAKDDFAVIVGNLKNRIFEEGVTSVAMSVDYPQGFSWDNCVVVSTEVNSSSSLLPHCYEMNNGLDHIYCQHSDDKFLFWIEHDTAQKDWSDYTYRIVLMKYEVSDSEYTLGDVNGDGQITQEDADLALAASVGNAALTAEQFKAADINKDGVVDTIDAAKIQKYVNGEIDSF